MKDTKGKPVLGLLPFEALVEVSKVREFGIDKYGEDNNWRNVAPVDFVEAALRHSHKWLDAHRGYSDRRAEDSESGINHLAHAACSLILALANIKNEEKKNIKELEAQTLYFQDLREKGLI
jgi:hypothetical protein